MTTLATEGGASEVINARRTESLDAPYILQLVQPWTEQLFGRVNVVDIIEKAVLAVTLSNESEEVMAHAAFFDYPNFLDVKQSEWEDWMGNYYTSKQCSALNSLFMHYFVARKDYAQGCAREIVRTAFNAVPDLHFIFMVVPMGVFPDASVASVFDPMEKPDSATGPDKAAVFVCHRHNHVPVLHIRKARVEDHDDLTPIFNHQTDMLKATYGNFFLAELIEAQDEHMQCLIAEVMGCGQQSDILAINMVEFGSGPVKEHIDNTVFIVPGIIIVVLLAFFTYKLVSSLRQKQKAKEEKKKQKQQKKEKETQHKQKKK